MRISNHEEPNTCRRRRPLHHSPPTFIISFSSALSSAPSRFLFSSPLAVLHAFGWLASRALILLFHFSLVTFFYSPNTHTHTQRLENACNGSIIVITTNDYMMCAPFCVMHISELTRFSSRAFLFLNRTKKYVFRAWNILLRKKNNWHEVYLQAKGRIAWQFFVDGLSLRTRDQKPATTQRISRIIFFLFCNTQVATPC